MVSEKEKTEFEIEEIIPVNIIKDSKQMRVTIPVQIVEKFNINPERHQFGWIIESSNQGKNISITGRFLTKKKEVKENEIEDK